MQLSKHEIEKEIRKTGIDVIGDALWGTHFCQFYEAKEDLIDVLVPYFKAGLENNEFCMWVTSEPLSEEEAKEAMRKAVPNFDGYLKRGQIEIVPHTEWYLKGGIFSLRRVLDAWIDKLNQALAKGYDGIRVTGNTAWLEKNDWGSFVDYEEEVNDVIGKYRMMAICTYSLDKCGASEVIDVVRNHQFALIKRRDTWELIEGSELKRAKEALKESEEEYRNLLENARDTIMVLDLNGNITFVNRVVEEYGFKKDEILGKNMAEFVPEKSLQILIKEFAKVIRGKPAEGEIELITPKGKIISEYRSSPIRRGNKVIGSQTILRDITKRRRTEEALRESEEKYRGIVELAPDGIIAVDMKGVVTSVNQAFLKLTGFSRDEIVGKHFTKLRTTRVQDIPKYVKLFSSILRGKIPPPVEFVYIRKDGSVRWGEAHGGLRKIGGKTVGFQTILRDITERKVAEDALRKNENKSRTLLENLPQKIFFKDKNSVYISCNENYARDLEIHPDEIKGKTDYDFYPEKLAEKYRADDKRIMESGKTEDIEEEYIQDGQKVFVHTVKTPVKYENGNVVGILGIFWDITERKRSEEKIRESEEKYRSIVELAPDSIVTLDLKGVITSCNTIAARMTGYSEDEIVGKPFSELGFLRTKDIPEYLKLLSSAERGKVPKSLEVNCIRKDGTSYLSEVRFGLLKEGGKTVGFQVIGRDITERKQMEDKLRQYSEHLEELVQKRTEELVESEKRYSVLVEEASDGVVIIQEGKILLINKIVSDISGYSKDELFGLSFEKLLSERCRQLVKERYMRRLRGETIPATYEVEFIAKTSERIPVEVSATLINYQGHPADLVIIRDIRERKRMEEERLKLEKLATIGELATMVGHDLRNPLQAITNAVYVLKNTTMTMNSTLMSEQYEKIRNLSPDPILNEILQHVTNFLDDHNKMIYTIDESVKYADKIVSDLQDFARTKEPELIEVDLESLIQETLSGISMPEKVKTSIRHDQRLSKLHVDPNQIRRVFANLTTNAIEAMPNGGKLTISTSTKNGFASFAFRDTGVGIPKENMKKLFTPLFTTKAKGMGMGLAICKKFIDAHGGTIEVESEEGKGTTFTIKLPINKKKR